MTKSAVLFGLLLLTTLGQVDPSEAPVKRRLTIRRSGDGYAVVGFRSAVGAERFAVTTGMTAEQVLGQIASVQWDEVANRLDDDPPALTARRARQLGVTETVSVAMTEPGPKGRVHTVQYVRAPVPFSRVGLVRHLNALFGRGQPTLDTPTQMRFSYQSPRGPVTAIADATLVGADPPKWQVAYTISDPRLQPTTTQPTSAPAPTTRPGMRTVYPTSGPSTPPGMKTVYPSSQPADGSGD
ncbi:MAG TPA: hypothetical protein VMZ31_00950 [Phycisphaerae bacterium]|nr:hypothetical protein [Phycisphaerae bacterium]